MVPAGWYCVYHVFKWFVFLLSKPYSVHSDWRHMNGRTLAWTVVFLSLSCWSPLFAQTSYIASSSAVGLGLFASVGTDGKYEIVAPAQGWIFQGSTGAAQQIVVSDGADSIGAWHQIAFNHGAARTSSIRLYDGQSTVLFSTQYGQDSANTDPFPSFSSYPHGLFTFNYSGQWNFTFGSLNNRAPWVFFDAQANAFVFSPASNFMTAIGQYGPGSALQMPIDPSITTLPAGFTHRSILAIGSGINSTFQQWGQALTTLWGKQRSASDATALLNQLSYWTDAGSAYYYHPTDPTQYAPQLLQMPALFGSAGIPLGSLELDSWYYPKGSPPSWASNASGMDSFIADTSVFPQGLYKFEQGLGLPLITHARWIDASSPLQNQYQISGNVAIDPKYWQDYAAYMVSNGVATLEQDWLANKATTNFNLTDPDAFLDNMASALASAGRSIVYCMPLSTHILQSAKYSNVVAVRVSDDAFRRSKWDEVLFDSAIPSALGLWPFSDAFVSANVKDVLLATLTAGPIGSGDAAGSLDVASISQAVRADGVIVKPDAPILPTDATFLAVAQSSVAPVVASTYTDHGSSRTAYVLAYERTSGALGPVSFLPASFGIDGNAYVFNYFQNTGTLVPQGAPFTDTVDYNGSYYIVAPIGASGIAFLGDADKFVSAGKKRIEALSDDGTLHVQVRFAAGENRVVLHFYSPEDLSAFASVGKAGRLVWEQPNRYRVTVSPGPSGVASLNLHLLKKGLSRPRS